ncbi:MAG: hypothetical protein IKK09_10255 [Clostridia bacterium]|nr:hypothetical protein [Clostridia bacterium]
MQKSIPVIFSGLLGTRGIVIINKPDEITILNLGGFRIELEAAKFGGISDPRNTVLMKMFTLIDIGERAGSGIPNIYSNWNKRDWSVSTISEEFDPERITLSLPLKKLVLRNCILSTALLEYSGLINEHKQKRYSGFLHLLLLRNKPLYCSCFTCALCY